MSGFYAFLSSTDVLLLLITIGYAIVARTLLVSARNRNMDMVPVLRRWDELFAAVPPPKAPSKP